MSRTNNTTQRKAPPMKKGAQRQNNSSKKTVRVQHEGARQQNSGIGRQQSVSTAYASRSTTMAPSIRQVNKDSCIICHRELLTSVVGTELFSITARYNLNPGLPSSFPWLSTMARSWEQYRFRKIKFIYLTRTGTNTPGSLMLCPDYDAADAAPENEASASSYEGVVEDAPWKDISCNLPSSRLNSSSQFRYIRTESLGPNLDIKTYDAGIMNVIVLDGLAGNLKWGKVWVEYEVEFKIPQLAPPFIPRTLLAAATSDLSQVRPLGRQATRQVEQTLQPIVKEISEIAGGTDIYFEKAFHGLLNYYGSGAPNTFTGANLVFAPTAGSDDTGTEGTVWTQNFKSADPTGAYYQATNLITMLAGSILTIYFQNPLNSNPTRGQLSLTPCGL